MNNSFGGGFGAGGGSPRSELRRLLFPALMNNLTIQIPTAAAAAMAAEAASGETNGPAKGDGLISLRLGGGGGMANERDLNNNLQKLNSLHLQSQYTAPRRPQNQAHYSPPSFAPAPPPRTSAIKSSVSNFKLSGGGSGSGYVDPFHVRNTTFKPAGKKQSPPVASSVVDEEESKCPVCDRQSTMIMCKNCGHVWKGRVRTKCQTHPSTVYLMDLEACVKCCSKELKELD